MARKPGPGICVHCLGEFTIRNWDHVLPKGWYPDTTPPNIEKWKIPTCKRCNSEYGVLEEELFTLLAFSVARTRASAGIHERALRSIDPSYANGKKDKKARISKRKRIEEYFINWDEIPTDHGTYPGLGERWGRPKEKQKALIIPADHLERFCEKIVRGIHYVETGNVIKAPYNIHFFAVEEDTATSVRELIRQHGEKYARGPGIEIYRAVPVDDPKASMLEIILFGELKMYSSVDDDPS